MIHDTREGGKVRHTLVTMAAELLTLLVVWGMILVLWVLVGCAPGPYLDYCAKPGNVQVSTTCEGRR